MEEEDNENAIKLAQQGEDDVPLSRLDRVRLMLERGVGYKHHDDQGRRSVAFANKVNALGLALTKLKPFRNMCFKFGAELGRDLGKWPGSSLL